MSGPNSLRAATGSPMSDLLPGELVSLLTRASQREFMTYYGETCFLLVRLDDAGELLSGLNGLEARRHMPGAPSAQPITFHTVVADIGTLVTPASDRFTPKDLLQRLSQHTHFAITLERRVEENISAERISVGRARNKDVVLRHASVSKFHAWFERDAGGSFSVADAGSKNGTRVNHLQLEPRQLIRVNPGDIIRFGSVEAVLCPPETMWKAAQPQ